jgi:hypothetical protein
LSGARSRRPIHARPEGFGKSPKLVLCEKASLTMATLPGLPQTDEPEPDALPVEPDDGTGSPGLPSEPAGTPGEPPSA